MHIIYVIIFQDSSKSHVLFIIEVLTLTEKAYLDEPSLHLLKTGGRDGTIDFAEIESEVFLTEGASVGFTHVRASPTHIACYRRLPVVVGDDGNGRRYLST